MSLAAPSALGDPAGDLEVDRIEGNTVYFKTPDGQPGLKPLKTEIYDLKFLGSIKPAASRRPASDAGAEPYLLFSGRPCKDCMEDSSIYAVRQSGGKPTGYVYPGKIVDPKSGSVVMESRAFFGRCLASQPGQVFVVFQKERVDRRHGLQSSVFVATPGEDHMDERLIERRLPRLKDTLRLVKAKTCQEVEGRKRLTLRRPLDVFLRSGSDSDDDDEEGDGNSPANDAVAKRGAVTRTRTSMRNLASIE